MDVLEGHEAGALGLVALPVPQDGQVTDGAVLLEQQPQLRLQGEKK